jgi:hypothetical protein
MQMISAFKALNTGDVYGMLNSWKMEIFTYSLNITFRSTGTAKHLVDLFILYINVPTNTVLFLS